jgi:hypothetical protein
MPIETNESDIRAISKQFELDDLVTFPAFIMIQKEKYYWFRNTVFKTQTIFNWIDDIRNDLAYLTGAIPWNNIPENIKFFWKDKGNLTEPISKSPLRGGSTGRKSLISVGEAPDIWHEMWFVAVSEDLSMVFLDNLLQFQNKFQKLINPVTAKPWSYKYILPCLEWPGWSKIPNLKSLPIEKRQIETALLPLRDLIVIKDEPNVVLNKSQFYIFFEGEQEPEEEEPKEPEKFDISEFGDIGTINFDWNKVDEFSLEKSKFAKQKNTKKPGAGIPVVRSAPQPTQKNGK